MLCFSAADPTPRTFGARPSPAGRVKRKIAAVVALPANVILQMLRLGHTSNREPGGIGGGSRRWRGRWLEQANRQWRPRSLLLLADWQGWLRPKRWPKS